MKNLLFLRLLLSKMMVLVCMITCLGAIPLYAIPHVASFNGSVDQKVTVSGKVVDIHSEPIIGASVVEVGTSNGVITDLDGNFTLPVNMGSTVKISYIGYKDEIVKITSGNTLSIILKENAEALDEVVVVGFGVQKKVNLTGAVGVVNQKEIASRPVSTATLALQ